MSVPPPGPQHPRSTPIAGLDSPITGSPVPGSWSAPPTPAEFAAGLASTPSAAPTATALHPPVHTPSHVPLPFAVADPGVASVAAFGMPEVAINLVRPRRSFLGWFVVLAVLVPMAFVGFVVYGAVTDAIDQANDLTNPSLSDHDRDALGLPDGVDTLFDGHAAGAVVDAFEERIGGSPTRYAQILLYSDYAFADAQDPAQPAHHDRYGWRSGKVGDPEPQSNDAQLEAKLFTAADVEWDMVAPLVDAAPRLLQVEDGTVSHVIVDTTFGMTALVIRVYVTGPRSSGYLEADPTTGAVLATH